MCMSTALSGSQKLSVASRQAVTTALRERGLRLTPQREAVCETIFGCPGHICAEHILQAVLAGHPRLRMNKTTVYRTLDLLQELGLVVGHRCTDGRAQYEPASRGPHIHAICRVCGALTGIDPGVAATFKEELLERYGFMPDLESYPISGLCPSCQG